MEARDDPAPTAIIRSIGWPAPVDLRPVTGGWDTRMWRFTGPDGSEKALRIYRAEPIFLGQSQATAAREEAALRAAAAASLPVPRIDIAGSAEGVPFFVLEWMPGRTLVDLLQRQPWRVAGLGRAFGRLQAQMHRIDCGPLEPVYDEFAESDDELLELVRRESVEDAFCHYDFHPLNVLGTRTRITALLDFMSAGIGDRRADLGLAQAILVAAPPPPGPLRPVVQLVRRRFTRAWEDGYRAEAGDWPLTPLFEAFGAAVYLQRFRQAMEAGSSWATAADIDAMAAYLNDRRVAAGLPPLAGPEETR